MQKKIFPVLVFFIGFYLVGIRLVGFDMDGIPGDLGDGRLNNFFLEHGYQYITGKVKSYWDAPFYYPQRSVMSISDNLWGTLPLYALFRGISFNMQTSYQLWFLGILALNFWSCFFCLKKLKFSTVASCLGAYILAFSLPVIGGLSHIQMYPKFIFPWIIYFLIRFFEEKKSIYLFFILLFSVYQMYCGIYLGFISILVTGIASIVLMVRKGFGSECKALWLFFKSNTLTVLMYGLLNTSILLIMMWPYIRRSGEVDRDYVSIARGLATPASYLLPPEGTLIYQWLRPLSGYINNSHEHQLFMGLTFIMAIIGGLILLKKHKPVRFWLFTFLITVVVTLNFYHNVSPYIAVYIIPGFEAIRAGTRIVQMELFFLGGLVAVMVDWILNQTQSKKYILSGLMVLFIVTDQFTYKKALYSYSKSLSIERIIVLKDHLLKYDLSKYDAFVYLPGDTQEVYKYHVDAMFASQSLGVPTVNGYTAWEPKGYEGFFKNPDQKNFEALKNSILKDRNILVISL